MMSRLIEVKTTTKKDYIVVNGNKEWVELLKRIFKIDVRFRKAKENSIVFYVREDSELRKRLDDKDWVKKFQDKIEKVKKNFLLSSYTKNGITIYG